MMTKRFNEIWIIDFEFQPNFEGRPDVLCMVAKDYISKKVIKLWRDDISPIANFQDEQVCLVAHYSLAELSCFKSLCWALPLNIFDTFVEFRNQTNGLGVKSGLLDALQYFGAATMPSQHKDEMRMLALRGGEYTAEEKKDLLNYCEEDVLGTEVLFTKLCELSNIDEAILHGRYMSALSQVEAVGIPIDKTTMQLLVENEDKIIANVFEKIREVYDVFSGTGSFSSALFEKYLIKNKMSWPRLSSGRLDLKEDVFKDMAKFRPEIKELIYFRELKNKYHVGKFEIGKDDRLRTMLSPFRSVTGRNQPSSNKFIFNSPSWMRSLIKPHEGKAICYIDWSQQEFGIAASLSKDANLLTAYESGDPYLAFAKQAGAAPEWATKQSHKEVRDKFKACVLAVQYGMGADSLALNIQQPVIKAKELLDLHHSTYKTFWQWIEKVVDFARLQGFLQTRYGWRILITPVTKTTTIKNFLMQATGAEMLRAAITLLVEQGVVVCAPVHDAILIEDNIESIDNTAKLTQDVMAEVSRIVLGNITLKTDCDIIKYPYRFEDPRGKAMWENILSALEQSQVVSQGNNGVTPEQQHL